MKNKIEIQTSKVKTSLLLIGSIVFVVFGLLFLLAPESYISPVFENLTIIRVVGIASLLFFGAAALLSFKKLFDNTPGLIIDKNGITDHTNAASVGLINWADITEIKTRQIMSNKSILIFTANPDEYVNRAYGFKKMLLKGNMKTNGTPLALNSSTLKLNFDKLEKIITESYLEHKV